MMPGKGTHFLPSLMMWLFTSHVGEPWFFAANPISFTNTKYTLKSVQELMAHVKFRVTVLLIPWLLLTFYNLSLIYIFSV